MTRKPNTQRTYWAVMQDGNLTEPFEGEYPDVFYATEREAIAARDEWRLDCATDDPTGIDSDSASCIDYVRIDCTITLITDESEGQG